MQELHEHLGSPSGPLERLAVHLCTCGRSFCSQREMADHCVSATGATQRRGVDNHYPVLSVDDWALGLDTAEAEVVEFLSGGSDSEVEAADHRWVGGRDGARNERNGGRGEWEGGGISAGVADVWETAGSTNGVAADSSGAWSRGRGRVTFGRAPGGIGGRIGIDGSGASRNGCTAAELVALMPRECTKHDVGDVCAVCLVEFEPPETLQELPCGHSYHANCIARWLRRSKLCPMCKYSLALVHPRSVEEEGEGDRGGGREDVGGDDGVVALESSPSRSEEPLLLRRGSLGRVGLVVAGPSPYPTETRTGLSATTARPGSSLLSDMVRADRRRGNLSETENESEMGIENSAVVLPLPANTARNDRVSGGERSAPPRRDETFRGAQGGVGSTDASPVSLGSSIVSPRATFTVGGAPTSDRERVRGAAVVSLQGTMLAGTSAQHDIPELRAVPNAAVMPLLASLHSRYLSGGASVSLTTSDPAAGAATGRRRNHRRLRRRRRGSGNDAGGFAATATETASTVMVMGKRISVYGSAA